MAAVVLEGVTRLYGDISAVHSLNLAIANKEFVVLLGPSGCGKTTTLNMIAGTDAPTAGHILFDGHPVEHIPPEKRNVAMVFQTIALYPHKSVYENIAFPLRMAKVPRSKIDSRVRAAAVLMRIEALLNRQPHELSGGQRQRVALGRAAIRDPSVFLFDEPLSALDAKLRGEMRVEIKKLHERLGATFIYVTHDQAEALTMADRIAVMDGGRLQQYGSPNTIYRLPANTTVANFIGNPGMNLILGRVRPAGKRSNFEAPGILLPLSDALLNATQALKENLTVGIRPESLNVESRGVELKGNGRVYAIEPLGSDQFIDVTYHNSTGSEQCRIKVRTRPDLRFRVGESISVSVQPDDVCIFDGTGGRVFPVDGGP